MTGPQCVPFTLRKCEQRTSTKSFYAHHVQRISTAAVRWDAKAIRHQIVCKKQKAMGAKGAATYVADASDVRA